MQSIQRVFALLAVLLAGTGLQAQEPWEGGFKLTAGLFPGAEEAYLGQGRAYGLAMFGRYPISRSGSFAFEGGYKFFPATVHAFPSASWEDKTDGYFASGFYQHKLWFEGFHLQGGVRLAQYVTARRANFFPGDGTSVLTKYRGNYATTVKPAIGAGYRLNPQYGLELNLVSTELKNVAGEAKTGTLVELSLLIHL
jgi:hypothetical protein